jgi:bifunctional DNase/RNase
MQKEIEQMLHKVRVGDLVMDPATDTPIIILNSETDSRFVPIWIGLLEAASIASALNGVSFDRPMTHDLFKHFLEHQDIYISQIDINDMKDDTYYALIHLIRADKTYLMDARPSDAIAMALRFNALIFVEE